MGILSWIILGAIAGFLAHKIMGLEGRGCFMNIILGIVGAVVGGMIFGLFGSSGVTGFGIRSMIVATIGAIIVIAIARALGGSKD